MAKVSIDVFMQLLSRVKLTCPWSSVEEWLLRSLCRCVWVVMALIVEGRSWSRNNGWRGDSGGRWVDDGDGQVRSCNVAQLF
jgi:hypothetical protein